jgi:peptide/nickel transport system permease protein
VSVAALKRNGLGVLGLALAGLAVLAALAAPLLAPHDPVKGDFSQGLKPPGTPGHPLGTDQLGRDTLSRVLYGARVALFIGLCTVLLTAIVGLGLRNIIVSLAAAGWVVYARVVRGEVLSVKQRDYVQAAAALGTGRARILFRHVLPNVAPSIIIVASLQFSQFIVAEAAISFLGFGVQPPTPAWGSMLSESRDFLYVAWWLAAFPGAALALTALGVNLVGDWLRDVLDPKFRV